MQQLEVSKEKEEELQLLPPKPKYECSDCHKFVRHLQKCKDEKKRCRNCMRGMITNKFYTPEIKRAYSPVISNFGYSADERKLLFRQFQRQGYSSREAWRMVDRKEMWLHLMRHKRKPAIKPTPVIPINTQPVDKESKKKFMEGLK